MTCWSVGPGGWCPQFFGLAARAYRGLWTFVLHPSSLWLYLQVTDVGYGIGCQKGIATSSAEKAHLQGNRFSLYKTASPS